MLKIGEFSKLSRVSIRMLRHYDTIGLLKPMVIHPETGYRYYGEEQLPIAGRIAALKEMGFRLSEIAGNPPLLCGSGTPGVPSAHQAERTPAGIRVDGISSAAPGYSLSAAEKGCGNHEL